MSLLHPDAPDDELDESERIAPDFLRLPQPERCFAERAARLRQLAQGGEQQAFLSFCAELAQAQQQVLDDFPAVPLPDDAALALLDGRHPPLPATLYARAPAWLEALRLLARRMQAHATEEVRPVLERLARARAVQLETQADWILHRAQGEQMAEEADRLGAPVLAAALQVYWTRMVTDLARRVPDVFGRTEDATRCPCCGSLPVASIVHVAVQGHGVHRYLHCALCGSEWYRARARCCHCEGAHGIAYQRLPVADARRARHAVVQAETCSVCGHYVKMIRDARDAGVDAAADDLASSALDVRMADAGMQRQGLNLMRPFGEAGSAPAME